MVVGKSEGPVDELYEFKPSDINWFQRILVAYNPGGTVVHKRCPFVATCVQLNVRTTRRPL